MGRKVLAVVTAMITAVCIIWIGYMIGTMIAPNTPNNAEHANVRDWAAYMRSFPTGAFVAVLIGYALGGFAGGFISTKMGRRWGGGMQLAVIVGVLLAIGACAVAAIWPQPPWFVVVGALLFVPVSLFGYKMASHAF